MSFSLTGNFFNHARGIAFADGGGITWSFNKNTNTISAVGDTAAGTVTSVGLVDGSTAPIYTVTNSPVTASGNLTFTLSTQTAHYVFAGPTSGSAAQPTFRALVAGDVPTLNQNTTGNATTATTATNLAGGAAGNIPYQTGSGATSLLATASGVLVGGTAPTWSTAPTLTGTNFSGIPNAGLTNSSLTVTAGTGLSGGGSVSLGSSVTLTNAGVTSNVAGTGVSVSSATGAVTISIGQSVATSASPTFAGLTLTSPLGVAQGGTGQTTTAAAYNALSPMTTKGDIEYESAAGTASRLAIGSTNQVLLVASGVPSWGTVPNAGLTNSSLTVTAGTGLSGGGSVSLGGSVTLTNAGVTSAVAGTGISVSGSTGAVTISIGQSVATSATPTFAGLLANSAPIATNFAISSAWQIDCSNSGSSNNQVTLTNNGIATFAAGGGFVFLTGITFTGDAIAACSSAVSGVVNMIGSYFNNTSGNSGTINVYYNGSGQYVVQNKTGSSQTLAIASIRTY